MSKHCLFLLLSFAAAGRNTPLGGQDCIPGKGWVPNN